MGLSGLIAVLALGAVALASRRLARSPLTMPMICLAAGFALIHFGRVPFGVMDGGLEIVAEITLAIVLFVDASRLTSVSFGRDTHWPARMLLIGLPLTLAFGTVLVWLLLPELRGWQAALIAALLIPTDAALGQPVFNNHKVPERLRNALTAEAGLNDGMALPTIIFLACAAVGFDHELEQPSWVIFAAQQIGLGIGLGALAGAVGGWLSHRSVARGWAFEDNTEIFGLLLVAIAYLAADLAGGNGFVAVFVAGLLFGRLAQDCAGRTRMFLETDGELLMMVSFFYIGAIMLPMGLLLVDWRIVLVVLLSLFAIRPAAIWLSLTGAGANWREKLFLGWFGPRGLATALFTLILLGEFMDDLPAQTLMAVAGLAVAISAMLHGVTARYAALLCANKTATGSGDPDSGAIAHCSPVRRR